MKFIVQSWYEVYNMWVKIVDNCFGETLYVRFKHLLNTYGKQLKMQFKR